MSRDRVDSIVRKLHEEWSPGFIPSSDLERCLRLAVLAGLELAADVVREHYTTDHYLYAAIRSLQGAGKGAKL